MMASITWPAGLQPTEHARVDRIKPESSFSSGKYAAEIDAISAVVHSSLLRAHLPKAYGPKLSGVHGSDPKDCAVIGAGGVGGVAHGTLLKSKKSSRSGCAASRAVR